MTEEQLTAMREHLAVEVMGWHKHPRIDRIVKKDSDGYICAYIDDWQPDKNIEQAKMVGEKVHRYVLTKHHNNRYEVWVYNTDKDGFPDGSRIARTPEYALSTAICHATGFDYDHR